MTPAWHALRLALEMAAWFVIVAGAVGALLYAMQTWLGLRLFR